MELKDQTEDLILCMPEKTSEIKYKNQNIQ